MKVSMKNPVVVLQKIGLAFKEAKQIMAIFLKSIETTKGKDEKLKR